MKLESEFEKFGQVAETEITVKMKRRKEKREI